MKKLSTLALLACFCCSLILPTSAAAPSETLTDNIQLTLSGTALDPNETYLDTAVVVIDGVFRKITAEEYMMIQQEMQVARQFSQEALYSAINEHHCLKSWSG